MISEGEIYDTVELSRTPLESIYVQHFYKVKFALVCIRPSVVYEVMMLLQWKIINKSSDICYPDQENVH